MATDNEDRISSTLRTIAREEAAKHPDDIQAATSACVARIKQLPNKKQVIEEIICQHAKTLIFAARNSQNAGIKYRVANPVPLPKVVQGKSPGIRKASLDVLSLYISGRRVGDIKGEELEPLAEQETALGKGHLRNAAFYRMLRREVPDGKRVAEVVKSSNASLLWKQAEKLPDQAWG